MSSSVSREVLVSITTYHGPSETEGWLAMFREVEELGLQRIALFLTGLSPNERELCYSKLLHLSRNRNLKVPFVHARADMQPGEYYWLMEHMGTEVFNLHVPNERHPHTPLEPSLRRCICLENSGYLRRADFDGFGGICLDISHLEDAKRRNDPAYRDTVALLSELPVLANHVSAISEHPRDRDEDKERHFDDHHLNKSEEVDYVMCYPSRYFGRYVALELINPLAQQLSLAKRLSGIVQKVDQPLARAA